MNNHIVEPTEKVKKLEQDLISQEGKMLVMEKECNAILDDGSMKHLTGQIKLTSSKDELIRYLEDKAWGLKEENQQLKEVLKECRDNVYNYQYICLGTLTKIDNAIGEK